MIWDADMGGVGIVSKVLIVCKYVDVEEKTILCEQMKIWSYKFIAKVVVCIPYNTASVLLFSLFE